MENTVITVAGKGGVGKTSISAAIVRALVKSFPEARILAIDADPAGGLATALDVETKLTLDDIRKADYVLTPGRYVGAAAQQDDGEPFEDKMARLTATLSAQFQESARLEAAIRQNLAGLGYEV